MGLALSNLSEALECRAGRKVLHPGFVPKQGETTHSISQLKGIVDLQFSILVYFMSMHLQFSAEFDVLSNPSAGTNVVAVLMINGNGSKQLTREMVEAQTNVDMQQVTTKMCEIIAKESPKNVEKFIRRARSDSRTFPAFKAQLLRSVAVGDGGSFTLALISLIANDDRERCCLFIEYNFLSEAYTQAICNNFRDLVPLIAYKASQMGLSSILEMIIM